MSASHTAIAIVVNETAMQWGGNRVNLVALIAFSAEGRRAFQTVFDQLVEVFSDRDVVQRVVRRGTTFPAFIDELVRVMDE
jgi:lichenan operon transcriptional antiterminator